MCVRVCVCVCETFSRKMGVCFLWRTISNPLNFCGKDFNFLEIMIIMMVFDSYLFQTLSPSPLPPPSPFKNVFTHLLNFFAVGRLKKNFFFFSRFRLRVYTYLCVCVPVLCCRERNQSYIFDSFKNFIPVGNRFPGRKITTKYIYIYIPNTFYRKD